MNIPKIETTRLILRRHEEKDFADMLEYLSDEEVVAFEPYMPMGADEVRGCLHKNIYFRTDKEGNPIWKDGYVYAKLQETKAIPELIKEQEIRMWEAAKACDREAFLKVVSDSAVMVCGGFRCTGAEYAEVVAQFDCKEYTIREFEVTASAPGLVQVHYWIDLTVENPANADLAGTFHITTTWQRFGETWKAIFNMDQRI